MSGFDLSGLADLIACPECHAKLVMITATAESLVCTGRGCRLSYPVREGIPVLLVDEAEPLEESAWQAAVGAAASEETCVEEETGAAGESES